jgi:hypothetical protein
MTLASRPQQASSEWPFRRSPAHGSGAVGPTVLNARQIDGLADEAPRSGIGRENAVGSPVVKS